MYEREIVHRIWEQSGSEANGTALSDGGSGMQRDETAGLLQMDLDRGAAEGVGYIPFLYMDPAHRRQGLGVQLLGQAVSTYRPLGRDRLRLCCAPDNGIAQRFYQKYGFVKMGEEPGARGPLDVLEKYIGFEAKES